MLNIVVGIPTINRAAVLRETLAQIAAQTRAPNRVIVCATKSGDVEGVGQNSEILFGPSAGASSQRNAIIHAARGADVIVFFDDDFLPEPRYLAAIERHMLDNPQTVVVTGKVLADGINGPGFQPDQGRGIITRLASEREENACRPVFNGYGCNMAVRLAPMHQHGLLFDEGLPLYSWQEDVDLSRQLAAFGQIMQVDAACGVHLGVKIGRGPGTRLGYSQVANPLYLYAKRRGYPLGRAIDHIARNIAKNLVRSFWPEAYIDRRGRLRGNLVALSHLATGRISPGRILDL
jgi:glycosyltransferase involved in cell wall biosynthesis